MKQRLIELLTDTLHEWECDAQPETVSQIAEHLIENGVIVPLCKVGDTVYTIENNLIKKWYVGLINNTGEYWECELKSSKNKYKYDFRFVKFDDFGKTVFLIKEEAEAKLKELSEK